jgi:hypothetical protein
MFLTNLPLNRHESSCMLLNQNGQFDRVAKPGVETSRFIGNLAVSYDLSCLETSRDEQADTKELSS